MLESLFKRKNKKRVYRDLSKIKNVLVLFEAKYFDMTEVFIKKLKKMGKEVYACGYISKNDAKDYNLLFYRMISHKKDLNWFGKPSVTLINDLNKFPCDALIDLSIHENKTLEILVSSVKSPLKIGMKKNDRPLYDFCISPPEQQMDTTYLGQQILAYLKMIQST